MARIQHPVVGSISHLVQYICGYNGELENKEMKRSMYHRKQGSIERQASGLFLIKGTT